MRLRHNFFAAFLGVHEFPVGLDSTPETCRLRQAHLVHPYRNEVGAELFAVQFDVKEPVILRRFVGNGGVEEIVAFRVIYAKELFHGKIVRPRESGDFCVVQLYLR